MRSLIGLAELHYDIIIRMQMPIARRLPPLVLAEGLTKMTDQISNSVKEN
jgi:hypothetical protein